MLRVAQWWAKPAIIFRMFSCVGLDCEIRALFFYLAQISLFFYAHTDSTDLTDFFDGVKSHRGWQMGRGACRSTLSAPSTQISKAHTNYFCWISLNLCEPKGAKVRRASVRFNARRAKLWDLWDLCEPKGARVREASVRFSVRRAKLWNLWDLCEA